MIAVGVAGRYITRNTNIGSIQKLFSISGLVSAVLFVIIVIEYSCGVLCNRIAMKVVSYVLLNMLQGES